ncbi:enoyl-CoA hydratase/isomerase family protein [Natrialbaceae archaeon A-chndr2]
MTYDYINCQTIEGRAEITLNRPNVMNAYTEAMLIELNYAVEEAIDDESVYVLFITGSGSAFCTGRDLQRGTIDDYRLSERERIGKVVSVMRHLYTDPKPSVAAINGPAVGGGMELALSCDFRIMSDDAFFRDGHTDVGFTPATGGAWLLPRLVGEARAKQATLLGEDINAETAVDWGLVLDAVPAEKLVTQARIVANRLRDKPARALRESKALFDPAKSSFDEHAQATLDARWACQEDSESREARTALRESREPNYNREY